MSSLQYHPASRQKHMDINSTTFNSPSNAQYNIAQCRHEDYPVTGNETWDQLLKEGLCYKGEKDGQVFFCLIWGDVVSSNARLCKASTLRNQVDLVTLAYGLGEKGSYGIIRIPFKEEFLMVPRVPITIGL